MQISASPPEPVSHARRVEQEEDPLEGPPRKPSDGDAGWPRSRRRATLARRTPAVPPEPEMMRILGLEVPTSDTSRRPRYGFAARAAGRSRSSPGGCSTCAAGPLSAPRGNPPPAEGAGHPARPRPDDHPRTNHPGDRPACMADDLPSLSPSACRSTTPGDSVAAGGREHPDGQTFGDFEFLTPPRWLDRQWLARGPPRRAMRSATPGSGASERPNTGTRWRPQRAGPRPPGASSSPAWTPTTSPGPNGSSGRRPTSGPIPTCSAVGSRILLVDPEVLLLDLCRSVSHEEIDLALPLGAHGHAPPADHGLRRGDPRRRGIPVGILHGRGRGPLAPGRGGRQAGQPPRDAPEIPAALADDQPVGRRDDQEAVLQKLRAGCAVATPAAPRCRKRRRGPPDRRPRPLPKWANCKKWGWWALSGGYRRRHVGTRSAVATAGPSRWNRGGFSIAP